MRDKKGRNIMSLKPWKVLVEEDVSPSKWFPLFRHEVELSNGRVVKDYYVSKLGDFAIIVALTDTAEVMMVRQYKHGAGEVILELPAGGIDNDSPETAAIRELAEETGVIADSCTLLGTLVPDTAKGTARMHAYLVHHAVIQATQSLDDNEEIEVVCVPLAEISGKISRGEITSLPTIAALTLARIKEGVEW